MSLVLALLAVFAAPASALDPRIPTPATFPANTPFWIGDAIDGVKEVVLGPGTYSQVYVDSAPVAMLTSISFYEGGAFVDKWSLHNFQFGLTAGTHHLEQVWYLQGAFWFSVSGDISFE
jgi:hypothetical protein